MAGSAEGSSVLPLEIVVALAYAVFLWATLQWLEVWHENPDLLLSAFVFVAVGLLIRIRDGRAAWSSFALLGLTLGFAYLSKSVMFPLSFVFLGAAYFAVRRRARALGRFGLALLMFLLVAGPYVFALSRSKGRLTFGDTGKLCYVWYANGSADLVPNWHRMFGGSGTPVHPMKRLLDDPPLHEFGSPVGGTYPPWYDASYWFEGVKPRFEPRGQLRVLGWAVQTLWHMFLRDGYLLVGAAIVLFVVGFNGWRRLVRQVGTEWTLVVPPLAAIAMYSLVVMWYRYIAPFAVMLWLGLFSAVRLPDSRESLRLGRAVAVAVFLGMAVRFGPSVASSLRSFAGVVTGRSSHPVNPEWETAKALGRAGIAPGDTLASLGYGAAEYFARLAKVRIVAEVFSETEGFERVPGVEKLLTADGSLRPEVIGAFRQTGAKGIVSSQVPRDVARHGWQQLGNTSWYLYPLSP